jgi:hypothetical protein
MGTTYPVMLTDKTRWNGQDDISDSTVIIHYEQGFGDSIMFSRYVEDIAKMAKKTIFVVQKNIIPLFKASGFDKYCTILPHEADLDPNIKMKGCSKKGEMYAIGCGMGMIEHEYHIPMMDTPYLLKETSSNIRKTEGYLKVSEEKVEKYRKKHINKNNKIKIGVAYHGTDDAALSYRDIPANKFLPLIKMENVEVYGFQADKYASELSRYTKKYHVKNLGKTFKNFETTACAIECMDVIISTDNVVMNLAGALGKKAYALFNVYPEFRWFKTEGEDVGWYKSVKPFRAKTFNDWENVIKDVKAQLIKDFNLEDKK